MSFTIIESIIGNRIRQNVEAKRWESRIHESIEQLRTNLIDYLAIDGSLYEVRYSSSFYDSLGLCLSNRKNFEVLKVIKSHVDLHGYEHNQEQKQVFSNRTGTVLTLRGIIEKDNIIPVWADFFGSSVLFLNKRDPPNSKGNNSFLTRLNYVLQSNGPIAVSYSTKNNCLNVKSYHGEGVRPRDFRKFDKGAHFCFKDREYSLFFAKAEERYN